MMSIIYSDTPERPKNGFFISPYSMDPVKQWLRHYENYRYLKFIFDNTKDGSEKRQANKEIQMAEKKMQYWHNMPARDQKAIEEGKKVIDQVWESKV